MYRQLLIVIVITAIATMLAMGAVEHWRRMGTSGGAPQPSAPGLARPNVVLIVLDALRADRLDAMRNSEPVMPKLARYARENVRFTNAVTACTWTRPSVASILTSLYMDTHQVCYGADLRHQIKGNDDILSKDCETLATFLKKAGYLTTAVQTNANCVQALGFAEGFDQYEFKGNVTADVVTDCALQQLTRIAAPFFMYLHYIDPHIPYEPPESYRNLFGFPPAISPEELAIVTNFLDYFWDHIDHILGYKPHRTFPELSQEAKEAVQTLYDGESRFLDDELARFLATLQRKQPNTIVVILADHGEHFWEHGCLGHGLTEYREEMDVPLILSGPGLIPKNIGALAETVDIVPTIAALLHLKANPRWQGIDLFTRPNDQPAFSATRGCWPSTRIELEAILLGSLKLILDKTTDQAELYDLATDPHEKHNLAAARGTDLDKLKALLAQHRQANIKARLATPSPADTKTQLDPALLDQLKSLGYVK